MRLTCSLEAPQPLGSALVRPLLVPLQPGAMAALQICALALPTRHLMMALASAIEICHSETGKLLFGRRTSPDDISGVKGEASTGTP